MDGHGKSSYMLLVCLLIITSFNLCEADPTHGFTEMPLTKADFELQRPYNVPLEERYSYENGIYKMWVYADDKPHDPNSDT
ncbi:citrate-binding protein-like protein [Corchorus olitorius]|uniref:Citrate-binding protein-like protein n=1 Tax=Corchorus olitorius TaxID=93759 RepID=A0A1R3HCX2_9ROSI|nr:citrate-binding protein-like protein [Corchorus olitorius]